MRFREADVTCFYCDYYDDGVTPTPAGLPKSADELARAAAADARITDKTCPHCGKPCPSYRKTRKHRGKTVTPG